MTLNVLFAEQRNLCYNLRAGYLIKSLHLNGCPKLGFLENKQIE